MIRDLTKSTISFSWALSLLGIKQAANLFRPGQQRNGDSLGHVTQATVDQLDDSMRGIFRTGDNLQAQAVDLAFASLNPINWINPGNWMRSVGNFGQQAANGSRMDGQQSSYSTGQQQYPSSGGTQSYSSGAQGTGHESYSSGMRGMGQPYYQTGQGSATDAALFWLNPVNWLNPNTWMGGGRSGGNCGCGAGMGQAMGQAGAAMGQAMGQAANQTAAAFSGQQPQSVGGTAGDSQNARSANWGPPRTN